MWKKNVGETLPPGRVAIKYIEKIIKYRESRIESQNQKKKE
uniref:Uncharacterized protein n=1 Tax=viral metagenome TaxID=1070528 RepID=A0A6C0ESH5_9ZZZZ